jgi:hypothetical protein
MDGMISADATQMVKARKSIEEEELKAFLKLLNNKRTDCLFSFKEGQHTLRHLVEKDYRARLFDLHKQFRESLELIQRKVIAKDEEADFVNILGLLELGKVEAEASEMYGKLNQQETNALEDLLAQNEKLVLFILGLAEITGTSSRACDEERIFECEICCEEFTGRSVLVPCGHSGICYDCSLTALQQEKCPYCRSHVRRVATLTQ